MTGRNLAPVEAVARALPGNRTSVDAAQLDALDEEAIAKHLEEVVTHEGRVDISFNAVGLRNATSQCVPIVDLDRKRTSVIMAVTSTPARSGIPLTGGVGPAMSAVESLTRGLSTEFAPHGVRVVGLRPVGMPDSDTIKEVYGLHAKAWRMTWE